MRNADFGIFDLFFWTGSTGLTGYFLAFQMKAKIKIILNNPVNPV
jgi:hypothetical protein